MYKKLIITLCLSLILSFGLVLTVQAQSDIIPEASGSSGCSANGRSATECGDYEISDFLVMAIKISQWILGVVGSLTLLMFVYGGITFLLSAGASDKVAKAKKIIVAAVVGLAIVFGSWLIINFVFRAMGLDWQGQVSAPTAISAPASTNN